MGVNSRGWTRTSDKSVNSRLLYQLSYAGLTHAGRRQSEQKTLEPRGGCQGPSAATGYLSLRPSRRRSSSAPFRRLRRDRATCSE